LDGVAERNLPEVCLKGIPERNEHGGKEGQGGKARDLSTGRECQ